MSPEAFKAGLPNLTAHEVAIAVASANRILIEMLVKAGVSRDDIEQAFRTKAGELIGLQGEDNAANLLRMMGGVSARKAAGE